MAIHYLANLLTDSVRRAQQQYYGRSLTVPHGQPSTDRDVLGEAEAAFIAGRDSFYLASVSEAGWPYVQHRGGRPGFLCVMGSRMLAFADYQGNRQLITIGNVEFNNRVALFLMDYRHRQRLKILGHARVVEAGAVSEETRKLLYVAPRTKAERIVFIDVLGYDWNCSKHIVPRYTMEDVEELTASLRERIAALEGEISSLRRAPKPNAV
jgi:predicted pyridoxine 5'-phosphate oxidase superfamily flavin-nucleotide-binding protein